MSREEFACKLLKCYFGDRNAFNDIVSAYNNLLSANEKAIEYINKNLTLVSIIDGKKFYGLNDYKFSYQDLLNILQKGGDNDENI